MAAKLACIAGEEIYRQWSTGRIGGQKIGYRQTPFGQSGEVFLAQTEGVEYYMLSRYGPGKGKTAPSRINDRANMYALKDLGVQCVLGWGPGGAITHTISVGELIILSDVVDFTTLRARTFFETSPLGYLRQFPVFCPTLRRAASSVLEDMKLIHHGSGTAAVLEGPRLETPAEVRMLATIGAEAVTHAFVPEVFLAKELQMCYAGICYIVNYAETGSRYRPFAAGDLFGGLTESSDADRLASVASALSRIVGNVARSLASQPGICECDKTMSANIAKYGLSEDWHKWF